MAERYELNKNSEGHFLLHDEKGFITYQGTFVSEDDFEAMEKENERLKRGDFTKEEFQALCHKLNEEDKNIFCDGCDEYQRKLFGTCRSDELKRKVKFKDCDIAEAEAAYQDSKKDQEWLLILSGKDKAELIKIIQKHEVKLSLQANDITRLQVQKEKLEEEEKTKRALGKICLKRGDGNDLD